MKNTLCTLVLLTIFFACSAPEEKPAANEPPQSPPTACTIVVIGSSTAEGVGASVPDSAWVNLFAARLSKRDSTFQVINLAKGGYTTFHLLPTGAAIDPEIDIAPDTARNISKALSYQPAAIIINLPSNDAARNIPVATQLENFADMVEAATAENVPVWICTLQPRNFEEDAQIALQLEGRDSIQNIYGEKVLDFWTEIATPEGWIAEEYDSGDGIHLNDRGHKLLAKRVMAARVWKGCRQNRSK